MKVYKITIQKSNNDLITKTVLAPSIEKAIEFGKRHMKKSYYYDPEIIEVEMIQRIDVVYKS